VRILSTLILSLCCLAASLPGNAIDIKSQKASSGYQPVEKALPNDALNDHYQVIAPANTITHISFQKEDASYINGSTQKNSSTAILNDSFQSLHLLFPGDHAKAFRIKLIFPQHYYW
jgi:hypothetical protein